MGEDSGQFAQNLITTKDLYFLIDEVELAEVASSEAGEGSLSSKLKNKVSNVFEESLIKLEKAGSIPASQEARAEYFRRLKEKLLNLPKVKIEIAFEPSEEFVKKISDFINSSAKEKIILEISVKPSIIAGATIERGGIFRDYSYADKLEAVIKSKPLRVLRPSD